MTISMNIHHVKDLNAEAKSLGSFVALDFNVTTDAMCGSGYSFDGVSLFLPIEMLSKARQIADAINKIMNSDDVATIEAAPLADAAE